MKNILFLVFLFVLFSFNIFGQYSSVLSQGDWYKIATNESGVYKLSYSSLEDLGVDVNNVQVSSIKLYGNGGGMLPELNSDFRHSDLVENNIKTYDANNNGVFESGDYILFYGESPHIWDYDASSGLFHHQTHLFSDEVNYFLTIDNQSEGKRIKSKPVLQNATKTITSFNAFSFHESESENLINSGKEWFGERFDIQNSQSFDFNFPNLDQSSPLSIKIAVAARSLESSAFTVSTNSVLLNTISINNIVTTPTTEYAKTASKTTNYNASTSNITITLNYSSSDIGASAWLNYIEINARQALKMNGSAMLFRDVELITNEVATYQLENATSSITIWNVSDPTSIIELPTTFNNGVLSFNDSINELHEYIAFNSSFFRIKKRIF